MFLKYKYLYINLNTFLGFFVGLQCDALFILVGGAVTRASQMACDPRARTKALKH